ncbi:2-amino-4-hydroxy-6-hydroxymethyldihydropteridine diphosphokinase [Legionella antarctica]|uniref:2-amino-4-hydroxy-6-hydroxymethyldihydropteridine pyrophosphokinase n=1 Tax=Legionella antarctica TaxID=2708020 RepID=A0A6F8T673_9GAMM|nr:2-amino-4-hydroxy-6-hydroxymethyldihydropteridine diphosphokinase [Legionella antarctica]BCA95532.1 2-amino-4-hydroxy-6-hydroxymethyldihydropteridine diphosphokinase [Legionella antarctica]
MNLCYLSLGSNQKFPERQIRHAIQSIRSMPSTSVLKTSSFYWSQAWGLQVQQDFCNVIVEITTFLSPTLLLSFCKRVEHKQGRIRKRRWGPRTLDIDIILYGNRSINSEKLKIPHPHMRSRDFVIFPLLELNPNIALPVNTLIKGSTTI